MLLFFVLLTAFVIVFVDVCVAAVVFVGFVDVRIVAVVFHFQLSVVLSLLLLLFFFFFFFFNRSYSNIILQKIKF